MLSKSHKEKLLTWLELLESLNKLFDEDSNDFAFIKDKWYQIQNYLQTKIMTVDRDDLDKTQQSLFSSWQTESYRYMRLLETDFLFYQSAKQIMTKQHRFLIIKQRLKDSIILTENYLLMQNKNDGNFDDV